ncbi:polyprenyl synthetase family protein [bacterium]|nr:polyprenyl synthetase family protein [bacterium]
MEVLNEILSIIKPYLDQVDTYIEQKLKTDIALLNRVERHIFHSNGKRIRPVLHLLSGLVCGEIRPANIVIAATAEFIHTATLLHDDVIDDSPTRRGKPTVNNLWGNELSVMVGDFFYTQSMNTLLEVGDLNIVRIFSLATQKMTEGEVIQHENLRNLDLHYSDYLEIIRRKTAVLFSVCCESAAVMAGLSLAQSEEWALFGEHLGISFQLIDDLLDYRGKQHETGKLTFCDFREKKVTMPLLHTLRGCSAEERARVGSIMDQDELALSDMEYITTLIGDKGGFQATLDQAQDYSDRALQHLEKYNPARYCPYLKNLTEYIIQRSK